MRLIMTALAILIAVSIEASAKGELNGCSWGTYELSVLMGPPEDTTLPIAWCYVSDVWGAVEQREGTYTFGRLDNLLEQARQRGWKSILRITPAGEPHPEYDYGFLETPEWLDDKGLVIHFGDYREPAYWNPDYHRAWNAVQSALIQRYKNRQDVMGFQISQHIWGELNNMCNVDGVLLQYESYGYSRAAWVNSIKDVIDSMERSRTFTAPNKLLVGYGFGLRDAHGWLTESNDVVDHLLSKPNTAFGTMQMTENGIPDRNVAHWAVEAKRRGKKLILFEDVVSTDPGQLRRKLQAVEQYSPDAIALQMQTWRKPWVKSVVAEFDTQIGKTGGTGSLNSRASVIIRNKKDVPTSPGH